LKSFCCELITLKRLLFREICASSFSRLMFILASCAVVKLVS
jgi:hypothetical protein